ncbi:AsmA2 domain-containing protein YhdP [Erwinia tracheiphila]|uniref:YhdP central domain-containing protein n=1 Tax=Erwinia tracheiphila TaxID=65700 RepID=A0A0M2KEY1_9GAMM|nr:AsmA2 domain-containing protein YhdP [Erwinia tracheiphila]KKF37935.1 hypothetical protein SY86_20940 [Erwinia tracheiphila]UIA88706.1 AsmA2 domain-containing protein YhdP [Erwinia tracheiphila]UIA97087.1 AsmA2 domain-containing protein YhdP [Erwinia tracheiphila]
MRRLPRILLHTTATIVVLTALLVSGLRLVMPHMNGWRETIAQRISSATGMPVQFSELNGKWENFGPVLDIKTIQVGLKDGGDLKIGRVTLALDVWQSLLHFRWQFRNLTFYNLNLVTNTPLSTDTNDKARFRPGQLSDLFLRQFDHFDLHQSQVSFLTPSGQRAHLDIPQLTWLNEKNRHRAEGLVSLSSFTGQHGVVQVRLDLSDTRGYLDTGRAWMQADEVDVKPWLGQWMRDNTSLKSARFSLAGWLSLREGEIYDGDVVLTQGSAEWQGDGKSHQLAIQHMTAHVSLFNGGWRLDVPQTRLSTDDKPWPVGTFSLLWLPEDSLLPGLDHHQEVRVRATHLQLDRLDALIPLFSKLSPGLLDNWRALQPRGQLQTLAVDIPLQQLDESRFLATWNNLSWQHWQLIPGMEHLSGSASGSLADGQLNFVLNDARLPYGDMFRAPLEIEHASGTVNWQRDSHNLTMSGHQMEVKARSLWAKGDFHWTQPENTAPRLDILAGINVTDGGDAWRYFPEPLMGTALVNYLSGAIKGGQVQNASLIFAGDPHLFPFKNNEGLLQVWVPLRQGTFQFQPGWPDLKNLDINLDFVNDGLFMKADQTKLGNVQARNISAVIPDYLKERLIIDGDIQSEGSDVGTYFNQTPLKNTLGAALNQLKISGDVGGHLHLNIPLDGEQVSAIGDVNLSNNQLRIEPLKSTVKQLSGRFTYDNGNLQSGPLVGNWFGQPLKVTFNTHEGEKGYQIGVDLNGDWHPGNMDIVPAVLRKKLAGNAGWQSNVKITLPHGGGADYQIELTGDMQNVSSYLPPPLDKDSGAAMPIKISARGNLHTFNLSGVIADSHRFNSQWLLGKQLRIGRGIWENAASKTPALPASGGMILNLPPLDGQAWFALLGSGNASGIKGNAKSRSYLPGDITLRTPVLTLGGQDWHELDTTLVQTMNGDMQIQAKGKEIAGQLLMNSHSPWVAHVNYLYYNPQWSAKAGSFPFTWDTTAINFRNWPALNLTCDECWLRGQNFGHIKGNLTHDSDTLTLQNGLIDSGSARLSIAGQWVNRPGEQRTALKGVFSGKKIDDAMNWFGMSTPLRDSPFNLHYDLHWQAAPWPPSEATLSGVLKSHLGAGQIADVDTVRAAQLLRLVSVDALLRKLRLDFTDTFSQGFYFDSINGTAWIDKGILRTDNLLVDGLEADIAMKGQVDLVRREINMEAVVAPAISATVGVAAAFAVNPVVGAAVFAASKVLGPLWNKISVLRYHISGPIDKPKIDEVLRKPRENSPK